MTTKRIPATQTLEELIASARADTHLWFPQTASDLGHMVLALCEEAGETAGALKKGQRGSLEYDEALKRVAEESIDVFIYLLNIWGILKVDPLEVLANKTTENRKRFERKS